MWCSLWLILYLLLRYWASNLSCSVELRSMGGNHEGDFEITYVFANNGLLPIPSCEIAVHLEKELGLLTFAPEMQRFSISEIKMLRKQFRCPRRGVYSVGGATVTFWDLLGIRKKRRVYEKQATIEVFPHKHPVEPLLLSAGEEGGDLRGNWMAQQDYTSIRNIREALPRESVRHVHWKASARTEELQIREYETRKRPGITIVLDDAAEKYGADTDGQTEERCVEVAAGLASYWLRKGYAVELATGTGSVLELKGVEVIDTAMRALMVFKPQGSDTLTRVLGESKNGARAGTVFQVITPAVLPDEAVSMMNLTRRALALFLVGSERCDLPEDLPVFEIPVR